MLAVPEIGGWQTGGYFYHCGNAASHSDSAGEPRAAPLTPSFRDAPLGAGPESITTIRRMDSGLALLRAPE